MCEAFASATVSPTQVIATAQAATLFAAGQPLGQLVPAGVFNVTQEFLKGMIMTKMKIVLATVLCAVLSVAVIGFSFAQTASSGTNGSNFQRTPDPNAAGGQRQDASDTDEAFIRRMSKDFRGTEPTPTEVHFFVTSKEAKRREKLVDLFIAERKAKGKAASWTDLDAKNEAMKFELLLRKREVEKRKGQPTPPDQELLKTNVELAKLTVREKKILVDAARDNPKRDETKIALLEIELSRAVVLLEQAELSAKIAVEKASER